MTKEMMVAKLEEMGANRWTKYGKDRLYFGGSCEAFGLVTESYKNGAISYAEFKGEKISNKKAGEMGYSFSNIYLDLVEMQLVGPKGEVYDMIQEKIDEVKSEVEDEVEDLREEKIESSLEGSEDQKRFASEIIKETEEAIDEMIESLDPEIDEYEIENAIKLKAEFKKYVESAKEADEIIKVRGAFSERNLGLMVYHATLDEDDIDLVFSKENPVVSEYFYVLDRR